jgi:hypothetical protein
VSYIPLKKKFARNIAEVVGELKNSPENITIGAGNN